MGTGKRRISTAARLEAKAEGGPVLELEHVLVQAELELVPVQAELELVLVQAELEHVPVAAERELARVAAEREHDPVAAEREHAQAAEREHGPVAVPLRIKWVTAVHHRGRVPLLAAVEDLAAVAEIMHAQAATEAATVWAAAVKAVVAAPE
jgi:hypothetical protein